MNAHSTSLRRLPVAPSRRSGTTILEVTISLVLLGAAFTILIPLLQSAARAQVGVERLRLAQAEAANSLERLMLRPYDQLKPGPVSDIKLSATALRELPQGELTAEVVEQPGEPAARRVSVDVKWLPAAGQKSPPCRLTAWVYANAK